MGRLEKALGSLYGLAIGDALGAPASFISPDEIKALYGGISEFAGSKKGIHAGLSAASVTDDTRIALAKARAIVKAGRVGVREIAAEVTDEVHRLLWSRVSLVGPSTSSAVELIDRGFSPWFTGLGGRTDGCAMSVAPVAVYGWAATPQVLFELVELSCVPTHCHFGAVLGAFVVAMSIKGCINGLSCKDSISDAVSLAGSMRPRTCLGSALDIVGRYREAKDAYSKHGPRGIYEFYKDKSGALTEDAVPAALAIASVAGDFESAVLAAANAGGDADTVAAITGSIKGAEVGIQGIKGEWVNAIKHSTIEIDMMARELLKLGGTL